MQSNSKKITFPLKNFTFLEFETIDSTNSWAKSHLDALDSTKITCVYALSQTSGRGRFNRSWESPANVNILASYVLFLPKEFPYVANLSQVLMCSTHVVLKSHEVSTQLKWPNDLILNDKKLSGVLCETVFLKEKIAAVVGIGLNVNMSKETCKGIPQPATSLLAETRQSWDWKLLLQEISTQFEKDLYQLSHFGFESFALLMNDHLYKKGESLKVQTHPSEVSGICAGINIDGSLKLITKDNRTITIYSGDLSADGYSRS